MISRKRKHEFNIMVAGHIGVGKTTLIQSIAQQFGSHLFSQKDLEKPHVIKQSIQIESPMKVRYTVSFIDTPGIQAGIRSVSKSNESEINVQVVTSIHAFIEQQYNITLTEEKKVVRSKIRDSHVHLVIYVLDPAVCLSHKGLSETDILFFKRMCGLVNIIPIIGKIDTASKKEYQLLSSCLLEQLNPFNLFLDCGTESLFDLTLLFSVFNGEMDEETKQPTDSREYLWGKVSTAQCDLKALSEWIARCAFDLREGTNEIGYQEYRAAEMVKILKNCE